MSINRFGHLFTFTTWGESHGPALGVVVDGCPPEVPLTEADIQPFLDARRPGKNKHETQRKELDEVEILSGVFEGKTTGTPISLMIRNTDQRSKDYGDIHLKFRPGHADLTYHLKYGNRDYRGGGRSSARETAARVAAGGVAMAVLKAMAPQIKIKAYLSQIGSDKIESANFDESQIRENPFFCPDAKAATRWDALLDDIRKNKNDSIGAVVEITASGVPAGLGAPVYAKLDTDITAAMMSINAVKAVEIGEGMNAATLLGSQNADEMWMEDGELKFSDNHSGGILGGISTGQDIVTRFAVKPTSSILTSRRTITQSGENTDLITKGRHDPCVGIRAVPVAEAMMALVLVDHLLLHRGQIGENRGTIG